MQIGITGCTQRKKNPGSKVALLSGNFYQSGNLLSHTIEKLYYLCVQDKFQDTRRKFLQITNFLVAYNKDIYIHLH